MGSIIGTCVIVFLSSFAIGTVITIIKELLARRKAAALDQNKNEEKEVD